MFNVVFFPIYGAAIGVNYWDSFMENNDEQEKSEHMIQIFLLVFGISFIWYKAHD